MARSIRKYLITVDSALNDHDLNEFLQEMETEAGAWLGEFAVGYKDDKYSVTVEEVSVTQEEIESAKSSLKEWLT